MGLIVFMKVLSVSKCLCFSIHMIWKKTWNKPNESYSLHNRLTLVKHSNKDQEVLDCYFVLLWDSSMTVRIQGVTGD